MEVKYNLMLIKKAEAKKAVPEIEEMRGGEYYKIIGADGTEAVLLTYTNRFHSKNLYIQPYFLKGNENCAAVFKFIYTHFGKPLQCTIDWDDSRVALLESSGFKLLRKCYEREFERSQLMRVSVEGAGIVKFTVGDNGYLQAAEYLFNQYKTTHAKINPLSVGIEEFTADLPQYVYCSVKGTDNGFAFVEENEICYVGGNGNLSEFFGSLLNKIFADFNTVQFEADDIDPVAMQLKNLFIDNDNASFDTWVFVNEEVGKFVRQTKNL